MRSVWITIGVGLLLMIAAALVPICLLGSAIHEAAASERHGEQARRRRDRGDWAGALREYLGNCPGALAFPTVAPISAMVIDADARRSSPPPPRSPAR